MATTVDASITALVGLLQASGDLTGVTVHDGPPMSAETPDWVSVGYQPGKADAVVIQYDWAQLGAGKQEERYDILCALMTSSGDETMSARRTRAVALRDAVALVLFNNRTLSNTVRLCQMTDATLLQEQSGRGALAGFTFTVACQARITA